MPQHQFQVVTDDEREAELAPVRELFTDAMRDKAGLVEPQRAKIKRVTVREGRGGRVAPCSGRQ